MTIHPRGLLIGLAVVGLFSTVLLLAVDFRLGLTTSIVAVVAYIVIEAMGMGLGPSFLTGRRRSR